MRGVVAAAFGVCAAVACYRPTAATDQPCAANHDCPSGQHCDLGQSPPICITGDGGAGGGGGGGDASRPADATPPDATADAPTVAPPDAMRPPDAAAPPPPISFVQAKAAKPMATTTRLTLEAAVGGADALIVCLNYPSSTGATVTSVTDTLGSVFFEIVDDSAGSGDGDEHYVFAAYDTGAGSDTITLSLSTSVTGADLLIAEYGGLELGTGAFDVDAIASGNSTAMDSGPATTHANNELLLGYAEAPSASAGAGFTQRVLLSGNLIEDRIVTAAGTYDATATTTAGDWTMVLVTFRGR